MKRFKVLSTREPGHDIYGGAVSQTVIFQTLMASPAPSYTGKYFLDLDIGETTTGRFKAGGMQPEVYKIERIS